MRELKRLIAHARMKRDGYTGVNKKDQVNGKSFFANNWREYCKPEETRKENK